MLVAAAWEVYKLVGPKNGGEILGWSILPRSNDVAMPHVWDMGSRLFDPESRTSDTPIWRVVLAGAWYSFRLAVVGFVIGSAVGIGLATRDGPLRHRAARAAARTSSSPRPCR